MRGKRISLREVINRKCKECIYDTEGKGTWRQQVACCTSKSCPLYPARPQATKQVTTETHPHIVLSVETPVHLDSTPLSTQN
jgi:hypothetical protein